MPARTTVRRIDALTDAEWAEIRAFGSRYFEGAFDASIRAKQEVVLLRDDTGALAGMGALEHFELVHEGRPATIIHVGNTAFDERLRGQSVVQRLGFGYFLRARLRHPTRPIFLAYTTFSWRSYLMLCRNFARAWPRHDRAPPAWEGGVFEQLGHRLLGDSWDPACSVGRQSARRLRPDIARIPATLADDPDLRFFAARNPGYANGDVLLCLAPLDGPNWLAVARNALGRRPHPT